MSRGRSRQLNTRSSLQPESPTPPTGTATSRGVAAENEFVSRYVVFFAFEGERTNSLRSDRGEGRADQEQTDAARETNVLIAGCKNADAAPGPPWVILSRGSIVRRRVRHGRMTRTYGSRG